MGIYGAAISTAIGYGVMTLIQYFTVQKFYYVKYEFNRLLKVLVSTAIVFSTYKLFLPDSNIGIKTAILLAYPVLLYLFRFFLKSEWNEIKGLSLKLLGRVKQS